MSGGLAAHPSSGSLEISREEIRRRLHDPTLVLVDVLAPASYASEHIPGAISLPVEEVSERARDLIPNLGAEIAVYCGEFT